jgi:hypothetical protein
MAAQPSGRFRLGQKIRQQPGDHHAWTFVGMKPALDMHMRRSVRVAEGHGHDLMAGAGTTPGQGKAAFTHGNRLSQVAEVGPRGRDGAGTYRLLVSRTSLKRGRIDGQDRAFECKVSGIADKNSDDAGSLAVRAGLVLDNTGARASATCILARLRRLRRHLVGVAIVWHCNLPRWLSRNEQEAQWFLTHPAALLSKGACLGQEVL